MGYFVTLEGPEGSGKTSVSALVSEYFTSKGIEVVLTREPGGIPIAEKIRELILDPKNTEMDDKTEAILYAASRRQHLVEKILPALDNNKLVLCDRFIDSSLAYQGHARGLGIKEVYDLNMFAIEGHLPDLTLFLDLDPAKGMERIGVRGYKDRLELEGESFHEKVYEGYQIVSSLYPERIRRVDASQSLEAVVSDVIEIIEEALSHGE